MLNLRLISKIMGNLMCMEATWLFLSMLVSVFYHENDTMAFFYTVIIALSIGIILVLIGKKASNTMTRRDGYFIVSVAWVCFTAVGMLPYIFSGAITDPSKAFFETMSGFTTTGTSILDSINSLPHGILLWRSLTQWLGGLGIVLFTVAVLPTFGVGDIKLFAAESTGPTHGRLTPRISNTAKWLWSIYLGLTILNTFMLYIGGISFYDSITHAMTTVSTGGYSTKQNSIGEFNLPYCEYVTIVFMFLGGCNFLLMYNLIIKRRLKYLRHNEEFKWYLWSTIIASGAIAVMLMYMKSSYTPSTWEESIRTSMFHVVSIMTSTGFTTSDFMLWPAACLPIILVLMLQGACAGSTTGGMKCIRIVMLVKMVKCEVKRILHPSAIFPLRVDGQVIENSTKLTLLAFTFMYFAIIFISWIAIMLCGVDFMEGFSVVISSLSNIGPAFGKCSSSWSCLPDSALWISTALMLIGRLEIFAVLLIFTPTFWHKN